MKTQKPKTQKSRVQKPKAKAKAKEMAVLVCTEYRGVFFGTTSDVTARPLRLRGLRCCLYWSTDVSGFTGLAERGPSKDCRISAPIEGESVVKKVTFVAQVTDAARTAWMAAPCAGR